MPSHFHAIVWIDHKEARIFRFSTTDAARLVVHSHECNHHLHHKANSIGSGHLDLDKEFLERVARALGDSGVLLIAGPSSAKHELYNYIHEHSPALAARIAAVEPMDHPGDGALLALARRFFRSNDRMQAQT